jgi:hypothetical protein
MSVSLDHVCRLLEVDSVSDKDFKDVSDVVARAISGNGLEFRKREGLFDGNHRLTFEEVLQVAVNNYPLLSFYAGQLWSDNLFEKAEEFIAKDLSNYPMGAYSAGKEWSDERFNKHANFLVGGVTGDGMTCYQAGLDWSKERFLPHARNIAMTLAHIHAEYAVKAGRDWSGEIFQVVGETLVKGITEHPKACFEAGKEWQYRRFFKHGNLIIGGLNEKHAYEAGKEWKRGKFNRYKVRINERVSEEPLHAINAMLYWDENRVNYSILAPVVGGDIITSYGLFMNEDKFALATPHFPSDSYGNLISKLSPAEKEIMKRTYKIASETFNKKLFFENIGDVLENGSVLPWCKHIIDHNKPKGIGGDTYRGVAV